MRVRVDCFARERLGWKKFVGRFVNEAIRRQHLLLFTVTSGMEPKLAFLPSSPQSVLLVRQRIKASFVLSENPQHARIHFFECAHSDAALPGRKPRKRKHIKRKARRAAKATTMDTTGIKTMLYLSGSIDLTRERIRS